MNSDKRKTSKLSTNMEQTQNPLDDEQLNPI